MTLRILEPTPGVSPVIGYYFSEMEEVRDQLRDAVTGLDQEHFGRPAFAGAHSIGALVMHIGEAEWWWMQCIVAGHKLTPEDRKASFWDVLEDPDGFATRNYSVEFCLDQISTIRQQTRELLASFADADLERRFTKESRGKSDEQSLRWILHHLIDHEAQHKGQILMLKRLLSERSERRST